MKRERRNRASLLNLPATPVAINLLKVGNGLAQSGAELSQNQSRL